MAADSKGYEDLSREMVSGLVEWRQQHPKATLAELEAQVQEGLAELHARLLEGLALASGRTEWDISQAPLCPTCQQPLIARGKQRRQVQAMGGKEIPLERTYGVCPACGAGLFPPG